MVLRSKSLQPPPAAPALSAGEPQPSARARADAQPPRLLIVEDNTHYATALRNQLEIEGFVVDVASDGPAAFQLMSVQSPTLIILDIMLPAHDGYEVLRRLRSEGQDMPVVLLTARRDEQDKLRGFGLGADDYVTKPVSIHELVARIRAVLRRVRPGYDQMPTWIRFGDVEIHPPSRTVKRAGREVDLRPKEYDLLLALLRQHGRIVSRTELLRDVWGYNVDTVSRTVDTHLAGLRQKLEADPINPQYFITIRSAGYMLRRTDKSPSDQQS